MTSTGNERDERFFYRRHNRRLALILGLALALRLLALYTDGPGMFLGTDDDNYRETAEILLKKGVLTYAGWPEPTVFVMPGYPILLAAVFAALGSTSWLAVRLLQIVISVAAVWFGAALGNRLGNHRAGLAAGLVLAVYPPNITAPLFLLTETVFTCLLLAALVCFMAGEEKQEARWFVLTGIILAVATYMRPTSGLLPVVFGVYLLIRRYPIRRVLSWAGICGLIILAGLTPWIGRNYMLYHEFIPFTVSSGNPFLRGTYIDGRINEKFPWIKGPRILSDKAQSAYGRERLRQGLQNDFWGYLRWYTVGKFMDYWGGPYYYRELTYLPAKPVAVVHQIVMWTGLGGLIMGLWRRKPAALLFLLVTGYFTAVHLVYLTGPRYSYPVVQLAVILAAYFAAEVVGKLFEY